MDEATADAIRALREAAWIMENGGFDKHLFIGGANACYALLNVYGDECRPADWTNFVPPLPLPCPLAGALACLFAAEVLERP